MLRYAQRSNEKLRHRRQQLRQKLQHLCASLLFKKAEIAYFTECANVREILEYQISIGTKISEIGQSVKNDIGATLIYFTTSEQHRDCNNYI